MSHGHDSLCSSICHAQLTIHNIHVADKCVFFRNTRHSKNWILKFTGHESPNQSGIKKGLIYHEDAHEVLSPAHSTTNILWNPQLNPMQNTGKCPPVGGVKVFFKVCFCSLSKNRMTIQIHKIQAYFLDGWLNPEPVMFGQGRSDK